MTNPKMREITRELASYAVHTRFDALPDAIQFERALAFMEASSQCVEFQWQSVSPCVRHRGTKNSD